MTTEANSFVQTATVILSMMVGLLAALPLALTNEHGLGTVITVGGVLLGLMVGLRRRTSRVFFYIALVAVLVLSSVVYSNLIS